MINHILDVVCKPGGKGNEVLRFPWEQKETSSVTVDFFHNYLLLPLKPKCVILSPIPGGGKRGERIRVKIKIYLYGSYKVIHQNEAKC